MPRQQGVEPLDFVFDRRGHGLQMFAVGAEQFNVETGRHGRPTAAKPDRLDRKLRLRERRSRLIHGGALAECER